MAGTGQAPLRLGIAGLGTVGMGVVKIIQEHGDLLARRAGRALQITAVSARDVSKDRGADLSAYVWLDDALDLAGRTDVDVVVELIGGSEGVAKDLVEKALAAGQHVVTANKALLAHHGVELAQLAERHGVALDYEASVAGGIPIIKAMRETGRDFDVILKEAQEAGYAEADPSFDIDGIDAGHKLALLSAIAFGVKPDFENLQIQGIRKINATDIQFAEEFGYRIKLLGIARKLNGSAMQVLEPCLVPLSNPIALIEGVYNAVYVDCDALETPMLTGKGAGEGPTASAVMSDVMDLARGNILPTFGTPAEALLDAQWADIGDTVSRYYLRLTVLDKPGVIADISAVLRDRNISIEGLSQHGRDPDQPVTVVLTTHEALHRDMLKACSAFADLESVVEEPCLMRIEALD